MLSKESDVQDTPTFRETLFSAQIFQFLVNLSNVGHLYPQRTQFSPCKEEQSLEDRASSLKHKHKRGLYTGAGDLAGTVL